MSESFFSWIFFGERQGQRIGKRQEWTSKVLLEKYDYLYRFKNFEEFMTAQLKVDLYVGTQASFDSKPT